MKTKATTSIAAEISWADVHAYRLRRHHLVERAPKAQLARVVGDIGGAQAQVMSFAEMQIAVRVDCSVEEVRDALWKRKSLVKTWLMRGTLHLIPSTDLPIYTSAMSGYTLRNLSTWLKYLKVTEPELMKLFDRIGDSLNGTPVTREELMAKAGKGQSDHIKQVFRSGWGSVLKPAARRGWLCFGPNRGQSVTFVKPEAWLGSWRQLDQGEALTEAARRYLRAYGPATKQDFARWWGMWPGAGTSGWAGLKSELVDVSVEGQKAQMLKSDLKQVAKQKSEPTVQLLPGFDPYLMGHASRDHLFDKAHRWKVSRVAGWISPVLLVDGKVLGVWTHSVAKQQLTVEITPFAKVPPNTITAATERAETIAKALGMKLAKVAVS